MVSNFASALQEKTPTIQTQCGLQEFSTHQQLLMLSFTDCLEQIEQKCAFSGDVATLMLTWAIAAHKSEMEVLG